MKTLLFLRGRFSVGPEAMASLSSTPDLQWNVYHALHCTLATSLRPMSFVFMWQGDALLIWWRRKLGMVQNKTEQFATIMEDGYLLTKDFLLRHRFLMALLLVPWLLVILILGQLMSWLFLASAVEPMVFGS